MKKSKEQTLPEELRLLLKELEKNHQFVEQERNVDRDWNQVTSVSLSLKFPLKDSIIGDARVDLIGRKCAFFKLDRFNVSILSADSTLMADMSHTAKLHYGAFDGPTFEFPFICTEEWEPGMYEILIHDDEDDSVLVIEFFLGDDSYPPHSYVCRDNETEEVDVRFHQNINN